ncbi:MAG: hypothetical protein ACK559_40525, partial [bacterium]
ASGGGGRLGGGRRQPRRPLRPRRVVGRPAPAPAGAQRADQARALAAGAARRVEGDARLSGAAPPRVRAG